MKERISAFAKGKVNSVDMSVFFEPQYISEFIEPDSMMQGSFTLSFSGGEKVKGCIFSTNRRMVVSKEQFKVEKAEITYCFYGKGMREGDIIQGDFIILCEAGEYRIPYTITARQNTIVTPQGRLRNLDTFVALAAADREEAYKAFCKHRFLNTLKQEDSRFTTLYKGLTRDGFSKEAMDEFLTAVRSSDYSYGDENYRSSDSGRRRSINNNQEALMEKDRIICLYELFLDFRCMKTSTKAWLIKTRALLSEQLGMKNDSGFYSLYHIHTLIIEGKNEEAEKLMENLTEDNTGITGNPGLYSYFLYLSALINMSEAFINLNCKRIWSLYKKNNTNPFILWILLMVEKEFMENPEMKWNMAASLYERGVLSPIILMEIALMFKRNPALCKELSDFNVQVLLFAARNDLLTPELYSFIYNKATRSNSFNKKVYLLLVQCYERLKDKESLQTICHYLIRNDRSGTNYFKWFELGVEQDLRIARLYDYYLYSVKEDMQHPLPEKVLQYFKFNMEIEYNKKSFLFANLYRFREEIPNQYEEYKEDMEQFVIQQLKMGRINEHLSYLYSELIDESYVNEENAAELTDLLFSYHATNLPAWANAVVVTDSMFVTENETPIIDGESIVYLYSDSSCILLKDGERKRFVKDAGVWKKWFENPSLLAVCEEYCPTHPGILLRRCDNLTKGRDPYWEHTVAEILMNDKITDFGKESVLQRLFDYFYEKEDVKSLETMLDIRNAYPDYLKTGVNHLSAFLLTGRFEDAYEYAVENGCEHILPGKLVPMCDYIISSKDMEYNPELYRLTEEIFKRGKYSENMLEYLIANVRGDNEFLLKLLNAGKEFIVDVDIIEEKLLVQSLFAGQLPESIYDVYCDYDLHGGKAVVKNAFLSFLAHETVSKNRVVKKEFIHWIDKRIKNSHAVTDVCKVLWLQAYSEGLMDDDKTAEEILDSFEQDDRFFSFYKNLPDRLQKKFFFNNKVILQCRTKKGSDVNCYYSINGEEKFIRKHMAEVYDGVFATTLPVFAKDELKYYITAESGENTSVIECSKMIIPEFKGSCEGRYRWIDSILSAESDEERDSLALDFLREDLLSRKLFS